MKSLMPQDPNLPCTLHILPLRFPPFTLSQVERFEGDDHPGKMTPRNHEECEFTFRIGVLVIEIEVVVRSC